MGIPDDVFTEGRGRGLALSLQPLPRAATKVFYLLYAAGCEKFPGAR